MSSWTFLPGYPQVSVLRTGGNILYLQQARFLLDESRVEASRERSLMTDDRRLRRRFREGSPVSHKQREDRAANQVYAVPVTYRVGSGAVRSVMLSSGQLATGTEWTAEQLAIANINRTGYYRVWYGPNISAHLADLSSESPLQTSADLFGLIDDYVRQCLQRGEKGCSPFQQFFSGNFLSCAKWTLGHSFSWRMALLAQLARLLCWCSGAFRCCSLQAVISRLLSRPPKTRPTAQFAQSSSSGRTSQTTRCECTT
jgi:hypothetical protein